MTRSPGRVPIVKGRVFAAASAIAVLVVIVALGFPPPKPALGATCTINWTGASSKLWNDGKNWSTNLVPTSGDFACIPASYAGEVVVDGDVRSMTGGLQGQNPGGVHITGIGILEITTTPSTINKLVLDAGQLQVDSPNVVTTLTLTGSSTWSHGYIGGASGAGVGPSQIVLAKGASLTIPGGGLPIPQQSPQSVIVNQGTLNWTGGDWCLVGDGVINDGTFNIGADSAQMYGCSSQFPVPGQAPVVNDAGGSMVRTSSAGTSSSINVPGGITNRGTVDMTSGILNVAGMYTSSGTSVFQPHFAAPARRLRDPPCQA